MYLKFQKETKNKLSLEGNIGNHNNYRYYVGCHVIKTGWAQAVLPPRARTILRPIPINKQKKKVLQRLQ